MSKQFAHTLINGFNRQPVLVAVPYANTLAESIRLLAFSDDSAERSEEQAEKRRIDILAAYGYSPSGESKPFAFANGVAFIPVTGILINRYGHCSSYVTGYNYIRNMLNAAMADDDVTAIVFDCDSGGGMVSGCFELCEDIYRSRQIKPSVAVVDAASYSACYAIASSAGRVIVTPSGGVGSVGVVAMHMDASKMLDDWGIKVTFIHSGDHKVDGNSFQPLKASVKADIQKSVDATREEFVALVARNRGLDPKVVYDTEAQCYSASEALALGLIDAVLPPQEAVSAFLNELSGSETDKEITMSTSAAKPGAESAATPETKAPEHTAQAVDASAERAAERQRIAAITTHDAAKDRPALASHLALNTDMSVDAAAKILAAAAPEVQKAAAAPAPTTTAFMAAMDASEHPNVGTSAAAGEQAELTPAQRILKSQSLATGVTH